MSNNQKYSFEEVKMMVASAESVTERRLSNNKTNYSINIAILVAIAIIWRWTITNVDYFYSGLLMIILISALAILFCSLWIKQITDFKLLNNAKFDVINEMSENLKFDSSNSNIDLISFEPFKKEWQKLEALKALQDKSQNNIISLKSTNTEYFIPKSFRMIFVMILLVSVISILFNPLATWEGVKRLLKIS